jgi:membrane protein
VSLLTRASDAFARIRAKAPWLDHLIQAGQRYGADQGSQLAAAVTYFSFLSLFPLLLLTVSVLGFVLSGHPELTAKVIKGISDALPGQSKDVINGAIHSRKAVGLVGLLGLLYSGLGWVANLRTAIRTVWHQNVNAGNVVTSKLNDLVILAGLGLALVASVVVSGVGNAATSIVIKTLGLDGVPGSGVLTKLVTIAIAMAANVVIFLYLFIRLPRVQTPWRRVIKGGVFAAVGFEILKLIGAFYIARTTSNATATYGALGVVIGALVWINLVSRFVIFAAVWTVTAPYDDDVPPSGTADPATAREAGIPTEFAEDTAPAAAGADATPGIRQVDGARTPLTPALSRKPGVGYGGGAAGAADGVTDQAAAGRITVLDPVQIRPLPAPRVAAAAPGRSRLLLAGLAGALSAVGLRAGRERFRR